MELGFASMEIDGEAKNSCRIAAKESGAGGKPTPSPNGESTRRINVSK
jgi:hypothetical protein